NRSSQVRQGAGALVSGYYGALYSERRTEFPGVAAHDLGQDCKEEHMATKLDKTLKREIDVNGEPYMLSISPEGLKLVPKGKRKGHEITWKELLSGQTALASAMNDSLNR